MALKRCSRCKNEQPLDQFHRDAQKRDGYSNWCKPCRRDAARARFNRDPQTWRRKAREADARWRNRHPGAGARQIAEYRRAHPEYVERNRRAMQTEKGKRLLRNSYTKKKFGLTVDEYDRIYQRLMQDQDGRCAVCDQEPKPGGRLELDHCHLSGRVRALLCGNCNRALGLLAEDPARISALAEYAARHKEVVPSL